MTLGPPIICDHHSAVDQRIVTLSDRHHHSHTSENDLMSSDVTLSDRHHHSHNFENDLICMEEMPTTSPSQHPVQERHCHLKSFRSPSLILFNEDTFAGVIIQGSLYRLTKTRKKKYIMFLFKRDTIIFSNVINFLTTITHLVQGGHHHLLQRHQLLDNHHSPC